MMYRCALRRYDVDLTYLNDTWTWDGVAWTKQFPPVVFGGDNGGGDCCRVYYGDTWTWDGIDWTQQFSASAPSASTYVPMAYDTDIGTVVLFGGFSVPGQGLSDTWDWDGSTWSQRQTPLNPAAAGLRPLWRRAYWRSFCERHLALHSG